MNRASETNRRVTRYFIFMSSKSQNDREKIFTEIIAKNFPACGKPKPMNSRN